MPDRPRPPPPGAGLFPATRLSAIFTVRSGDERERARSREILANAYWKPIYKYYRLKWNRSAEEAEDLTQAFFAKAFESDLFSSYDPSRARFRTFVRMCADRFLMKVDEADRAQKRGAGRPAHLRVEFEDAERELARGDRDVETAFDREWARSIVAIGVEKLAAELKGRGKYKYFEVFERYELAEGVARASYADVAKALGISTSDVTNYLFFARRELRRIILDTLRELTATEEEFRAEAKTLLGVEP